MNFLQKLKSRKLLMAVGTVILKAVWPDVPDEVVQIAGVYIIGESAVDAAAAIGKPKL